MESHNRYAALATDIDTVSIASSSEDGDATENSPNVTTQEDHHRHQHRHQLHSSTNDDNSSIDDDDCSTRQKNPIKVSQETPNNATTGASKGSPSTMDPALRNSGAKRHMSSLRGATQPTKVLDEKPPTTVVPIDTASQPCRTDGTWARLKHATCEVSSQDEQAAPTLGSPITTVGVESRLDGVLETTIRLPGQQRVPIKDDPDVAGTTTFSSILP
ncbi:uncharacterized protein ARMOST_16980 [Armillaria ostoyae]|uniref:Uncharacterized protein n=1 Tax=Armillaria ostoyae TaxID=47428 RepID=A0A284RXR1_ARMOS|nr:uncharacterized protein ARMOST_16980 [Armillaria ostoyae]